MLILFVLLSVMSVIKFHIAVSKYIAARYAKLLVKEFSLGTGPILYSIRGNRDPEGFPTKYCLRMLPFGASCQLERTDYAGPAYECEANSKVQRSSVITPRVLIFGVITLSMLVLAFFSTFMYVSLAGYKSLKISSISEGSYIDDIGLEVGDIVKTVGKKRIFTTQDFTVSMLQRPNIKKEIVVLRSCEYIKIIIPGISGNLDNSMLGYDTYRMPGLIYSTGEVQNHPRMIDYLRYSHNQIYSNVITTLKLFKYPQLSARLSGQSKAKGLAEALSEVHSTHEYDETPVIVHLTLQLFGTLSVLGTVSSMILMSVLVPLVYSRVLLKYTTFFGRRSGNYLDPEYEYNDENGAYFGMWIILFIIVGIIL